MKKSKLTILKFYLSPHKIIFLTFALLAILYAGTKSDGKGSYENGKNVSHRQSPSPTPLRQFADNLAETTNLLNITAFNVSTLDQTLSFEMSWQTNLFDVISSRNVYLFMSTNLLEKKWRPLGLYEMPLATNATSFSITEHDVVNSMKQNFRDAFYDRGFFFFSLDFDSDNDGLSDAIEKYCTLTDPIRADTDDDGLLDGDETSIYFSNPILPDTDGDGIPDGDEINYGINPLRANSDNDGLTDAQEIGFVNSLYEESFLWIPLSTTNNLLSNKASYDSGEWKIPLFTPFKINNIAYTNVAVCMDGIVHLLCPTNINAYLSSRITSSRELANTRLSDHHISIALLNADLYALTNTWNSKILYDTVNYNDKAYSVIEYQNIGLYKTRNTNELITCEVIFPHNETNTIYVSYLNMSSSFLGSSASIGAQLPKKEKSLDVSFNSVGSIFNGATIAYHFGIGSDPTLYDTDNDGLNDLEELTLGSSPQLADTDGDGLNDEWEIRYGLNPLSAYGNDGANGDIDGDGLTNIQEFELGTDPFLYDTDCDNLSDSEEIAYSTNPIEADTDGDGLSDGEEVYVYGTNPLLSDSDNDGLSDLDEIIANTNPLNPDSDEDGLFDGWEVSNALNPLSPIGNDGALGDSDQDGVTNIEEQDAGSSPLSSDTDNDGLWDSQEIFYGTNPTKADSDGDGLTDKEEIDLQLNPNNYDMDRDGLPDGWEVMHRLNPQSSIGSDGAEGDPDNDGLLNIDEYENGTDPQKADTDDDGVSDGKEILRGSDPTDPTDGGIAPPQNSFKEIDFNINGDYATWEMTIEGLGPNDTRTYKLTMAHPGSQSDRSLKLRKGNSYRLKMKWLNCDGYNDDQAPWYCWQAQIDGLPRSNTFDNYSNFRTMGWEWIIGEGWIAENIDGLLTSHIHECTTKWDGSFGGGNVAEGLTATLYVLEEPKLIFDENRDGVIDSYDEGKVDNGSTLHFWINDDADELATDGKYAENTDCDIPNGSNGYFISNASNADCRDNRVNGWSDLLDFTPVYMNLSFLANIPTEIKNELSFKIRQNDRAVNLVWTKVSKDSLSAFHRDDIESCGRNFSEDSFEAETETVSSSGIVVPEELAALLKSGQNNLGVFYIEGCRESSEPLCLDVYYHYAKMVSCEMNMRISSVEDMFWQYSIRGAERNDNYYLPSSNSPNNLPENQNNKTIFFAHGFNVGEEASRAWGSEIFKRLWQSGSNAKFKTISWTGDYNWTGDWANGVHYHEDVFNALKSAPTYKCLVEREEPNENNRILISHSLGNMMTCEALRQGLKVEDYFIFDGAVASEAFKGSLQNNSTAMKNKYVPSDWHSYHPMSWASNWYMWFQGNHNDSRKKMGWPNYFQGALTNAVNVYNYYSSGDPIFEEESTVPDMTDGIFHWPTLSFSWPFITFNITKERYSWQKQETHKGVNSISGTLSGGWGFHCWQERIGDSWEAVYYTSSQVNAMVGNSSITNNPVFDSSGTQMKNPNATQKDIWKALAKYIPAISSAVGKSSEINFSGGNCDLNGAQYRHKWGRNHRIYEERWLHSDMKDMAFKYVYPLYDEIVLKGNIR